MSDSYTEIKYTAPPQSRNEAILAATVDGTQYTDPPQSRIEDLLLQVKEKIEQGGGGGTSDYDDLNDKPQINGVTLSGDKSSTDLGLQAEITANNKLSSDLVDDTNATNLFVTSGEKSTWNGKQNVLSFDSVPTDGSTNPVESNGIYDALAGKIGTSDYATTTTAGIVKPDGVTTEVDENGVISVSTFAPTSWGGVQNIVRVGLASKFFKVRDQLQCMKGNTVLTWDIIGIDQETPTDPLLTHSLTLQLHDCITELQFDAKEALFAFENGLPAGAYHFAVSEQPGYVGDVGKTVQFTLTQAIPSGGQLVINNAYNETMIGATVSSYESGSAATAIETVTMSEGNEGIDIGAINNAGNFANGINSVQRAFLGSNRWSTSAIRQYLNSDAAAGEVWNPQTPFDRLPTWSASEAGFLNGVDADFIAVLGTVQKVTALNTACDGGGAETLSEKVFLLSQSEVYGGDIVTGGEGAPYEYYSRYSDLPNAGTGADNNRIKYRNGVEKYWWLRSPLIGHAGYVRGGNPSGAIDNLSATYNRGVDPVVAIV